MKLSLILAVMGCTLVSAVSQDMQLVIQNQPTSASSQKDETVKFQSLQSKANIEFENFFANLSKSNNAIKLFDLTQPVDVKKTRERVLTRSHTERTEQRAVGIKLLSIRF